MQEVLKTKELLAFLEEQKKRVLREIKKCQEMGISRTNMGYGYGVGELNAYHLVTSFIKGKTKGKKEKSND